MSRRVLIVEDEPDVSLLATLAADPGRVFSREELLAEVWEIQEAMSTRTVDVHIRRLRQALGSAGDRASHQRTRIPS